MRRFLILTTALLAGGLLPACGDDATGPESIFGLYTLVSINGEALPVDIGVVEISAGSIQLNSDGTYSISLTADLGGGPETATDSGTFTVDGSTVVFDGFTRDFNGTVSGNTLTTILLGGETLVFRK